MQFQRRSDAAFVGLAALASTFNYAAAQDCETNNVTNTVPADGTGVALQSYSYCGGTLNVSSYIENVDYDKIVQLYYTNADDVNTALTVIDLNYQSSVPNANWEIWFASTPQVNLDGITHLTNLTYQATDVGQTYSAKLGQSVIASGPAPTTTTIPAPYASPTGFSQDISDWLAASSGSQAANAKSYMFANIEIPNAANGTVIAAQSYSAPDYAYNWVRDSSLTMDVVASLYAAAPAGPVKDKYSALLFRYATARAGEQNDPGLQTGLGEPKFNLDNSIFTGPWGRPQNDGPATAAVTLIEFSNAYLAAGGEISDIKNNIYDSTSNPNAPVQKDLQFVANNYSSTSFDLWEEEQADHFYTKMVQYRAMVMGSTFANTMGDSATAGTLDSAATAIANDLSQFWDPIRGIILYEYGPVTHNKYTYLDTAVLLGVIHGQAAGTTYDYTNDQVLATCVRIAASFKQLYSIAATEKDSAGNTLAPPIGRYPEDTYNGVETTGEGNPWFLCTSSFAEVFYRAATAFNQTGVVAVSETSKPFWDYFAAGVGAQSGKSYAAGSSEFGGLVGALEGWGDAFLRTVKQYTPAGGHTPEEYDRTSGAATGAADLTWSYASLLTAAFARANATGDDSYVTGVAGL